MRSYIIYRETASGNANEYYMGGHPEWSENWTTNRDLAAVASEVQIGNMREFVSAHTSGQTIKTEKL